MLLSILKKWVLSIIKKPTDKERVMIGFKYGKKSRNKLATCHPDLISIFEDVIKYVDIVIIEGHRGKEKQNKYYNDGRSKVRWSNSKHNANPSNAVDWAVYFKSKPHIRWSNKLSFTLVAGLIMGIAFSKGIMLRWGGDWNMDYTKNESFIDLVHVELHKKLINGRWMKYSDL